MSKRIYLVTGPQGEKITERLVEATMPSVAINHAAKLHFSAKVCGQQDLLRLSKAGIEVEAAGDPDQTKIPGTE